MSNLPVPAIKDQADLGARPVPRQAHQKPDEWLLSLLNMWNVEKLSQSQCAKRLGVTPSMISGQINRHRALGFENRPRKGRQVPKKPFVAKPKKSKFNPPDKHKLVMHHIAVAAKPIKAEPVIIVDAALKRKQVFDLVGHDCRWPVEGYGHDMWYCGEIMSAEHDSYCVVHAARAAR